MRQTNPRIPLLPSPIPEISIFPNDARVQFSDRIGALTRDSTLAFNVRPFTDSGYSYQYANPGMRVRVGVSGSGYVFFHLRYTAQTTGPFDTIGSILVDGVEAGTFNTTAAYNVAADIVAGVQVANTNSVVEVVMPIAVAVALRGVSTSQVTIIDPPARPTRVLIADGDSRIQGLLMGRAVNDFVSKVGVTLNAEVKNLAVGGAQVDPARVSATSGVTCSAGLHMSDINNFLANGGSLTTFGTTYTQYLTNWTSAHPGVPLFLLTSLWCSSDAGTGPYAAYSPTLSQYRQKVRDVVAAAGGTGAGFYVIEGNSGGMPTGFADGVHPTTVTQANTIAGIVATAIEAVI